MPCLSPRLVLLAISLFSLTLLSGGCCPKVGPMSVTVSVDPSLQDRTVYVDLIALNESSGKVLAAKSMTEYWDPRDTTRTKSLSVYPIQFTKENPGPHTLSEDDPIWETWGEFTELYVLAQLPVSVTDQPGDLDPRRLILPLDRCRWDGETIEIVVKEGLVTHTTKLLPPKESSMLGL